MWVAGKRIFQAERRPSAKALRCIVCSGNRRKAVVLEQSEQGRERKEMRCKGKEWLDCVGL